MSRFHMEFALNLIGYQLLSNNSWIVCSVDQEIETECQDPLQAGTLWFPGNLWWGQCI